MRRIKSAPALLARLISHESSLNNPFRAISRFSYWQIRKRFLGSRPKTIKAFSGSLLKCYPDNASSNSVVYFGWPDWNEMHLLDQILRPGDNFLDIGANVGIYSVLAAARILPKGRVVAFEPDPLLASRLRENFRLNGLSITDVHQVAVGDRSGTLGFHSGSDALGHVATNDPSACAVKVIRIDQVVPRELEPVAGKIDVEGFEYPALTGTANLLAAGLPRLLIVETNDACKRYGDSRRELHDMLNDFGYTLFQAHDKGQKLVKLPIGGPYPLNSVAVSDMGWLRGRQEEYPSREGLEYRPVRS